jgi:TonB family protein
MSPVVATDAPVRQDPGPRVKHRLSEAAMRRVFACIALLAVVSLGCAARPPIVLVPLPAKPAEEASPRQPIVVAPPAGEELPKFGEYVFVEELPEAIRKVAPQYPEAARRGNVSGTVMVHALVGRDGRVKDTRVVSSIRMLDAAAVAAVRQWVFKPALTKNRPVAVWVAVPIKFTLH